MQGSGIRRLGSTASALAVLGLGLAASPLAAKDITIKMAVPDWPPTRIMQDLANESYKAPSGNNVRLEADFIPWPNYYERLAASLTSGEQKYQMVVSDSQWLGAFVEGGYYMKINDFIDNDPELQEIFGDLHPNLVASYSTYPHKSENFYGFPQMPDVLIVYYRTDLFCDESEQAAYQEKYGKKLPCDPAEMDDVDWDQVKTFGEFFRRAKGDQLAGQALDDDFYGIAYQAGKAYDFNIMQVNAFIWQHGADIWDETKAPEGQAEGVVNSDTAVQALDHYLSLLEYMPPVVKTGTMDIFKVDELFREGKVAWIIQWIGFAESAITPATSKVADKIAFAVHPGTARGRRQDQPLGQHRRPAVRHDHLERRRDGRRDGRLREVVAVAGDPDRVRAPRRAERPAERLQPAGLRRVPAVEPDLGARASTGRRTSGTCRPSSSCWCSRRRSSTRRSPASSRPRRRSTTSPPSSRSI